MRPFAYLVTGLVTAGSLLTNVAGAAEIAAPLVTPVHDVDVTYRMATPDGQSTTQRMRWNAIHWAQRIDPANSATFMLTDYRAHRLSVVDTAHRTYTVSGAPSAAFAPPGTPAGGTWRRGGPATVAGLACTIWSSVDSEGKPTEFCYSDDGLLLRAVRDGVILVEATQVAATPQGPEVFREPEGFREIAARRMEP